MVTPDKKILGGLQKGNKLLIKKDKGMDAICDFKSTGSKVTKSQSVPEH
ncbi:MAG: hypothetical protein MUP71_04950 [Candidatus Aminicenantes bacterium]|nr:hypothetical protein [Candidatus Aminicenantes bacterium]